jgi:hypothetical protein
MSMHRDLLAELELTMVPSLKIVPEPGCYVPASEPQKAASRTGSWRRRVWCSLRRQEVEVEFETRAFLGFPRLVGVNRCTAFDEPKDVACGRHCLDSEFRRRWPPALPVADRRSAG